MMRSRLASVLRRLSRRSWRDRGLLLVVALTAMGLWAALRLVSFQRLVRWTDAARDSSLPNDAPSIQRLLWAVQAVVPRLFRARPCLPQALTARLLLARRGVATHLRLGVTHTPDRGLQAHAWLERAGDVLLGGDDAPERYAPLSGTPPSARPSPSSSSPLSRPPLAP